MKDLPLLSTCFSPQLDWLDFTLHKVEWTSCGLWLERGCMDFTWSLPFLVLRGLALSLLLSLTLLLWVAYWGLTHLGVLLVTWWSSLGRSHCTRTLDPSETLFGVGHGCLGELSSLWTIWTPYLDFTMSLLPSFEEILKRILSFRTSTLASTLLTCGRALMWT